MESAADEVVTRANEMESALDEVVARDNNNDGDFELEARNNVANNIRNTNRNEMESTADEVVTRENNNTNTNTTENEMESATVFVVARNNNDGEGEARSNLANNDNNNNTNTTEGRNNHAIVAYEGRPSLAVEAIMRRVVSINSESSYLNNNTKLLVWLYDSPSLREELIKDWMLDEMHEAVLRDEETDTRGTSQFGFNIFSRYMTSRLKPNGEYLCYNNIIINTRVCSESGVLGNRPLCG
jgi:aspartyl-tRNA synthetase